ncbi:MAG TPA: DUF4910 domain-containing protein [Candidatus Paceibacterota bacterium]
MTDDIKKLYHDKYLKDRSGLNQDYLHGRVFETLGNFFDSVLKKPFFGKLLDLGCGDGSFVKYCKSRGIEATGIDINNGVNFERDRLPYKDNSFDIVFMYAVIEHITDPSNILTEIKRVLSNNGVIVLITPNFDQAPIIFYDDPTHVKPYNPTNLSYLMKLFGFKEEFIGLWTVKKSPLIWKLPRKLQFLYGRLLPFAGTTRYIPSILKGKSKTMMAAFKVEKEEGVRVKEENQSGSEMYDLIKELYPICRSITGNGLRETLRTIKKHLPLEIKEVPSGAKAFDWNIPKEWNIKDAYIKNSAGEKIVDFKKNNLHVLNYSAPIRSKMNLAELKPHLFTLPDRPEAIPYLTSYYNENWGFCLAHSEFERLADGDYEVVIDSTLKDGALSYGELYIKGETAEEILFSTYVCHPSLANDNLTGPVLLTFLAKEIMRSPRRYSYRFLFVPETIGAIAWLSQNEDKIKNIKGGYVATCLGDSGVMTYQRTKAGSHYIDKVAEKVLADSKEAHKIIDFSPNGSDERQFSSPGFNLPIGSLVRTLYGLYGEYHTSDDNLDFVKPEFLANSLSRYKDIVSMLESDEILINQNPKAEPRLGKWGLYSKIGGARNLGLLQHAMFWILSFSDGKNSLVDIAVRSKLPFEIIKESSEVLKKSGLLKRLI